MLSLVRYQPWSRWIALTLWVRAREQCETYCSRVRFIDYPRQHLLEGLNHMSSRYFSEEELKEYYEEERIHDAQVEYTRNYDIA